ncbi:MAG: DUF1349 domain-containing protein [Actinomycetota bacterium]
MDVTEFMASLRWLGDEGLATVSGDQLTMRAGPGSDWFNDPDSGTRLSSAPVFCATVTEDCQLSAEVGVAFASAFDAGVLLVHQTGDDYAKLCFERAPGGEHMVVSVVTRGVSDDANGPVIDGDSVRLRVSRFREVIAFHWSTHATTWNLLRYFQLRDPLAPTVIGFLAQSPTGQGCTATFSEVSYTSATPADIRDGS